MNIENIERVRKLIEKHTQIEDFPIRMCALVSKAEDGRDYRIKLSSKEATAVLNLLQEQIENELKEM